MRVGSAHSLQHELQRKQQCQCQHSAIPTSEKAIQGMLPLTPVLALNANTYCPNVFQKVIKK